MAPVELNAVCVPSSRSQPTFRAGFLSFLQSRLQANANANAAACLTPGEFSVGPLLGKWNMDSLKTRF